MSNTEYGTQTSAVRTLLARALTLTPNEIIALATARDAIVAARGNAAWAAAGTSIRASVVAVREGAAQYVRDAMADARAAVVAAGNAAGNTGAIVQYAALAAGDAALALVVRGLIPDDVYRTLTGPWAEVVGPAHPDDLTPEIPHEVLSVLPITIRGLIPADSYKILIDTRPQKGTIINRPDNPHAGNH
jgi:hypothetical protein